MSATAPTTVRLQRTFAAPPERVYDAWLQPALMKRWFAPDGVDVSDCAVDARIGGAYRVRQQRDGVPLGGFDGEFLELEPGIRIVLRWGWVGPDGASGPVFDSQLTITFAEIDDDATELTILHERLDQLAEAMPDVASAVSVGWGHALDKLSRVLVTARG